MPAQVRAMAAMKFSMIGERRLAIAQTQHADVGSQATKHRLMTAITKLLQSLKPGSHGPRGLPMSSKLSTHASSTEKKVVGTFSAPLVGTFSAPLHLFRKKWLAPFQQLPHGTFSRAVICKHAIRTRH